LVWIPNTGAIITGVPNAVPITINLRWIRIIAAIIIAIQLLILIAVPIGDFTAADSGIDLLWIGWAAIFRGRNSIPIPITDYFWAIRDREADDLQGFQIPISLKGAQLDFLSRLESRTDAFPKISSTTLKLTRLFFSFHLYVVFLRYLIQHQDKSLFIKKRNCQDLCFGEINQPQDAG
jgi:hypothetical protein